jgi:hypothetical protein
VQPVRTFEKPTANSVVCALSSAPYQQFVNGPAPGNRTEIPFREPPRAVQFLKTLKKVFMSKHEFDGARTIRPGRSVNGQRVHVARDIAHIAVDSVGGAGTDTQGGGREPASSSAARASTLSTVDLAATSCSGIELSSFRIR